MGHSIFVTATDTDAGKSFVTAGLTRALLAAGYDACALKPVSCGHQEGALNGDVAALLAAQGMQEGQAGDINLYDFAAYAAPLVAARAEGLQVDASELSDWCRQRMGSHALSMIEGVGGLMVPLAEGLLVSDWLESLPQARVLLVVRVRLGGINQALLSLDKLQRMGRAPDWVVVNAADAQGDEMMQDHCDAIAPYLGEDSRLMRLPFMQAENLSECYWRESPLFKELEGYVHDMQVRGR